MGILQDPLPGMDALAVRQPSIEEILYMAVEKNAGIDAIERLVALKSKVDAERAEADFNEAMNQVQAEIPVVLHDKENTGTKSRYATYEALDAKVRPIYLKHGFAVSFSPDDCPLPDHIRMLAYVTRGGYTRKYQCDMPADGKGAKGNDVMSKTHAHGSAHSYAKRYLLKDIFNIITSDDVDDDGNAAGAKVDITEDLEWIANAKDTEELKKFYFPAYKKAQNARDKNAMQQLLSAKNRRLAEING